MTKLTTFLGTTLGRVAVITFTILLTIAVTTHCSGNRQAVEQGKQDSRTAGAVLDAVDEAVETAEQNAQEDAEFTDIVDDAVAIAKDQSDEKVSRATVVAAICSLPNYSDDPSCSVRESDSKATD